MISSQYLLDIIKLLVDEKGYKSLIDQLPFIEESKYEYTNSGVFITFSTTDEGLSHKFKQEKLILDGVLVKSPELNEAGAEAILHINDGIIDYLEIWCYDGTYPKKKELCQYSLTQIWKDSKGRQLEKK